MVPPNRPLPRYASAAALIGVSVAVAEVMYRITGTTRLSTVFLAAVLVAAYWLGAGPAYFAAALSFFVYDFYLVDPRFTFTFPSPEEVLNLAGFLAVAMLTGQLTGRVRDQAARATQRAQAATALLAATREFSAAVEEDTLWEQLVKHLALVAQGEAWILHGGRLLASHPERELPPELFRAAEQAEREDPGEHLAITRERGWFVRPLQASGASVGAAAWRTLRERSLSTDEQAMLGVLADSGATAVVRLRLAAGKAGAEAAAHTERLRNALLSSISHDLRTPLASILVAATSLRRYRDFDDATREDLASTIEEEAERLDSFVANLLSMTRLEAGGLSVADAPFSVREAVSRVVARRAGQRVVEVSMPADLGEAAGDPLLFEQALGNVLENALRYAPPQLPIRVSVETGPEGIEISVADEGPGVSEADLQRIFEKFYRSGRTRTQPGTGLGLSIARGLLDAMGGAIEARNGPGRGLVVTIRLAAAS